MTTIEIAAAPADAQEQRALRAAARFHLGVGQVGRADDQRRDDYTLPLFPLVLIMDAEGTLAAEAKKTIGLASE